MNNGNTRTKKPIMLCTAIALLQLPSASAQTIETFESITSLGGIRPTAFTSNAQPFTITSSSCNTGNIFGVFIPSFSWSPCNGGSNRTDVATAPYGVGTACSGGNCSGTSNKFIDNGGLNAAGAMTYSIKTTNAALFTIRSLFLFLSADGVNPSDAGGITVRGKRGGVTKFTYTKTTGFNTGFAANNGFTYIDFSTGTDFTNINIDELELQAGSAMRYIALDNFSWAPKAAAIVSSAAATAVNSGSAQLNGSVNDNGAATVASFDYSTSPTLTSGVTTVSSSPASLVAEAGPTAVNATIQGLSPSTTYYYRLRAVNGNGTGLGNILSFTTTLPLPIGLTAFQARSGPGGIDLSWATADEKTVQTYEIMKSTDGTVFRAIGQIAAAGQSNYSFEDTRPVQGFNFYRLQLKATDGSVLHSGVAKVFYQAQEQQFLVTPNPAEQGIIRIEGHLSRGCLYRFRLADMSGKTLVDKTLRWTGTSLQIGLDRAVAPGIYSLSVSYDGQRLPSQMVLVR